MSETEPAYTVEAHPHAANELDRIPEDARSELIDMAYDAATHRQPSEHQNAKLMRDGNGLFRLRYGDYRALCALDSPRLVVLAAGPRKDIYDRTDEAKARLGE